MTNTNHRRAARRRNLPLFLLLLALFALRAAPLQAQDATTDTALLADAEKTATVWSWMQDNLNAAFGSIVNDYLEPVLFHPIGLSDKIVVRDGQEYPMKRSIPLIIVMLVFGGVYFTFFLKFVNIRLSKHAVDVIRGRYDKPGDTGEVSHFKALTCALSGTIGLGNIAGVAVAISAGGPGAVFWMWVTAVFGMSLKFSDCTMSQLYRIVKPDGSILGGPMVYIDRGFKTEYPSLIWLGKMLAVLFSILTIFAAFGGGNMFQTNQTYAMIRVIIPGLQDKAWFPWLVGLLLAIPAGLVIIGGIKRIGEVTKSMVPAMCGIYMLVCLIIIIANITHVPSMFQHIFSEAFSPEAMTVGGFIGVLVQGMKRAAFSNEAGLGSSAIAHAAAKTEEPVREGVVAMIEPVADTLMVCTATALAILITGVHEGREPGTWVQGASLTAKAFEQVHWSLDYVLALAVFIFAFSTVITWCYYGERAVEYLFGEKGILPYRIVYTLIVIIGPLLSLGDVIGFADMLLLSMIFPNVLGLLFLSRTLKRRTNDYIARLKSGAMKSEW